MSTPNPDVFIGIPKEEIDTPALLIDMDIMEANIQEAWQTISKQSRCRPHCPHVKTHKTPIIAHKQMEAGAIEYRPVPNSVRQKRPIHAGNPRRSHR